jgi:ribosome-binding protein aMBF1 (putative translation factor)
MTNLASLRDVILSDPEANAEYERLGPIFAVVGEMVDARQSAGLTQAELACRMGTSQSVIARLESARHMPTFDLISRYARALDRRIEVHLAPLNSEGAPGHA